MHNPREHLRCSRRGCNYTTNRAYNLERHERNHDKGKVPISQCQPCPHCSYAAGSLHNLMRHIGKKHAGIAAKTKTETLTIQQVEQQKEAEETTLDREQSPEQLQPVEPGTGNRESESVELLDPSLWFWGNPQQQEKNFLKRTGLKDECKIQQRTVKMFKFYTLVKARGGALNVDEWDDVTAALGLVPGSGCQIRDKYMELLYEHERKEEERVRESQDVEGVPPWWDDGDFITDNVISSSKTDQLENNYCPSVNARNAIVKLIYDKYYTTHLKNSKPFERFPVKDSWLQATMLNYQALKCEILFRHCAAP